MSAKVYILLPVHNRRVITAKFIGCLAAQSYSNYYLILIDDGSTDGTAEMVESSISNLTVIKGGGDWWWAGSLQQGIDWLKQHDVSDRDVIVMMNDDVTFESDFLQIAVSLLDHLDGLLLPQVMDEETGLIQESGVEADLKRLTFKTATSPDRINCLPTRGLFMRMSDLRKVGNFYPTFLPHYLSDYEFTIRAHKKGVKLTTSPKLVIRFDEGATGYRTFDEMPLLEFLKRYFSIKSASNPLYWTAFILLTTPKLHVPWNVLKIWLGVAKQLLKRVWFA